MMVNRVQSVNKKKTSYIISWKII